MSVYNSESSSSSMSMSTFQSSSPRVFCEFVTVHDVGIIGVCGGLLGRKQKRKESGRGEEEYKREVK